MSKFNKTLYIFTRDLRIQDNLALNNALKNSHCVYPIFIFTYEQISPSQNKYFSLAAYNFLLESLKRLSSEIKTTTAEKLSIFIGNNHTEVLNSILAKSPVDCVYMALDYTLYARERAQKISEFCSQKNIYFNEHEDYLLNSFPRDYIPDYSSKKNISVKLLPQGDYSDFPEENIISSPYQKLSSYIKNSGPLMRPQYKKHLLKKIKTFPSSKQKISLSDSRLASPDISAPDFEPVSREEAFRRLDRLSLQNYARNKDDPRKEATSKLSPFIKFGVVSIREVANISQTKDNSFMRELYFRDLYAQASYYFSYLYTENWKTEKSEKFADDTQKIKCIYNADTESEIVNLALNNLFQYHWIHNRYRQIIATYFYDADISWKKGELMFARNLVDYDPSNNLFNWLHHSSSGLNFQWPYRKMKVSTQEKKYL